MVLRHGRPCEQQPNWACSLVHRQQGLSLSAHVDDIEMAGKKAEYGSNVEEIDETCGILTNQHFFY